MTEVINFAQLLNTNMGDSSTDAPKPLPSGIYMSNVVKWEGKKVKTQEGEKDLIEIYCALTEGLEGVDEDVIAERGGLKGRTQKYTIWLADGLWKVQKFIEACGAAESGTLQEGLDACVGCEVMVMLKIDKSGEYNNITKPMVADLEE